MNKHTILAALVACLLTLFTATQQPPPPSPGADARLYAGLALSLAEFGVLGRYTDGAKAPRPAGDIMPLYPLLVAGLIRADPRIAERLHCEIKASTHCTGSYQSVVALQVCLFALFLFAIWAFIVVYTDKPALAWLGMFSAWLSGATAEFTHVFLTEALALPLFALVNLALVVLLKRRRSFSVACAGGLALGLLVLTRPAFWYAVLGLIAVVPLLALSARWRRAFAVPLVALALTAVLVVSPWLARNYVQFDQASLSVGGYGGITLAQRITYNGMTAAEFGTAFIYWLPDFGDGLAAALLPSHYYRRLNFEAGTFYGDSPEFIARTLALAGSKQAHVGYLLKHEVLGHPVKHALVTLPLAWRGMFVAKYWGLLAWICVALLLWRSARKDNLLFLAAGAPALFMLVFQAAISVSIPRYNLPLLPILSLAIALQLERGYRRFRA